MDQVFVEAVKAEKLKYVRRQPGVEVDVILLSAHTIKDDFISEKLEELEERGCGNFVCQRQNKNTIQYHCERLVL